MTDFPTLTSENFREVVPSLADELESRRTLDIPRLASGLYAASGGYATDDPSGYQHAWVRDNVMVAYSRCYCGDTSSALSTLRSIGSFLRTQMPRMSAIINEPSLKEDDQQRPHVRFDAHTLAEIKGDWAHAQNDALGYAMWMRFQLASIEPLDASECELWDMLARYFGAIEYWRDQDSGAWEESRKVNASSVGTVLAALNALGGYRQTCGSFGVLRDSDLREWIDRGRSALTISLPFESPPARRTDAALLFLIHPLSILNHPSTEDRILSLVRARLMGPYGIRRYIGDSYYCQDYDEWFGPADRAANFSHSLEVRDELLRPGCEAQWCLFDPILSVIYGARFQHDRSRKDFLNAQLLYFNRALTQITHDNRCAELYYLKGNSWIPNEHTPLAWTQANLAVAMHSLKNSVDVS